MLLFRALLVVTAPVIVFGIFKEIIFPFFMGEKVTDLNLEIEAFWLVLGSISTVIAYVIGNNIELNLSVFTREVDDQTIYARPSDYGWPVLGLFPIAVGTALFSTAMFFDKELGIDELRQEVSKIYQLTDNSNKSTANKIVIALGNDYEIDTEYAKFAWSFLFQEGVANEAREEGFCTFASLGTVDDYVNEIKKYPSGLKNYPDTALLMQEGLIFRPNLDDSAFSGGWQAANILEEDVKTRLGGVISTLDSCRKNKDVDSDESFAVSIIASSSSAQFRGCENNNSGNGKYPTHAELSERLRKMRAQYFGNLIAEVAERTFSEDLAALRYWKDVAEKAVNEKSLSGTFGISTGAATPQQGANNQNKPSVAFLAQSVSLILANPGSCGVLPD